MRPGAEGLDADRIGGLVWFALGAAIVYGSWTMDRLEALGINPLTAPGVLPGLIGLGLMGFALVLLLRRRPEADGRTAAPAGEEDWRRLALSWALCLLFAGILLGRGLPFWLLAAAFVFAHVMLLDDSDRMAGRSLARRAGGAAVIAVGTAAAVTFVFQSVFLIRLP